MNINFEIVIIEYNPSDAEMMVRSLGKNNLANNLTVQEDGANSYIVKPVDFKNSQRL